MKKIALISCSSKKLPDKARARELYSSPLFKLNLNYAKSLNPDNIYILSAKYGLLDLEEEIEPYNLTLNSMKKEERQEWAEKVLEQLKKQADLEKDEFIFLAGKKYYEFLLPRIKNYQLPLKNLGIGKQLAFLKKTENNCSWIHNLIEKLPLIKFPFDISNLPNDGIYFFYEQGEVGHNGDRIVRVGTHKDGNFKSRIKDHFVFNEDKIENLDANKPKPSDRSIFRKNIGRALIEKEKISYSEMWEQDFTKKQSREQLGYKRNIELEKQIERKISSILRKNFSFRFIKVERGSEVIGKKGVESRLIATLAKCNLCNPSKNWLGNFSPVEKIRKSGLWNFQHVDDNLLTKEDKKEIKKFIEV